ncbi:PKD domain-containing protein [Flammeovirga aprica]|uniref:T9SS type A sorting domain-containing protein n=1 Tax=Flammeovirga aprica JL-4 TaxID=694437 RepID=A0A7X9RT21_9BACT|nr:PKD domain-containing protein [Flammeovirga aprica]NME66739.1 T9SS type A sorting domain-containing protein [Flammeovirga aprica JL-4]
MKRSYSTLLIVAMISLVTFVNTSLFAQTPTYSGGTGTQEDPFLIGTAQDLYDLSLDATFDAGHWAANVYFKLTADIDMAGIDGMNCIGYEYNGGEKKNQFQGKIDGDYHVIRNLYISGVRENVKHIGLGLFGSTHNAKITNLGLVNPYINALAERVGPFVGNGSQTTLENCFVIGGSIEGESKVGSIMGKPNWGTIVKNCFSSVEIRARYKKNGAIFGDIDNITETCLFENLVFYGSYGISENYNKQTEGESDFGGNDGTNGQKFIVSTDYVKNIFTILEKDPKYSTAAKKTPLELTEQATYTGFDFTDGSGKWVMKENSFAVLQGFSSSAFDGLTTFAKLPLQVIASDNTTPIEGATVTIDGTPYTTNAEGKIDNLFFPGVYDYEVTKTNYQTNSGTVNTEGEEMAYVVFLRDDEMSYNVALKFLKEGGAAIEGVSVTVTDGDLFNVTLTSGADGIVTLGKILAKQYSYTTSKDLFIDKTSNITVTKDETFEITLDKDNKAPVADTGADRVVASGDLVTLDGSFSTDPNGDALTYTWESVDPAITLEATEADVDQIRTFTAPAVDGPTDYTFKLKVSDGELETEGTVVITVKGAIFYGPELIKNGSFENALTEGWTGLQDVYATSDDVPETSEGSKSIKIFTKATQIGGYHDAPTEIKNNLQKPLIIGRKYVLKGKVKAVAMSMNVINLRIMPQDQWYDGAKLGLTRPTVTWGKELTLNEWIEFEKIIEITPEFTSDPNDGIGDEVLSKLNIFPSPRNGIGLDETSLPEDEIYLDDMSIVEYDADIMLSAGENIEVRTGATANLMGSFSTSDVLALMWTSKEGLTITNPDAKEASFVVPAVTEDTQYTFTLSATKAIRTETSEVVITALPNAVASAGDDQTIEANQEVTLDASASLPANVTLEWSNTHDITLDDATSAQPKFTAPLVDEKTDFTFTVKASYKGMDVMDEVVITVLPITKAMAGEDQTAESGEVVTLDGSASTPSSVTYAWTAPEGITLSDATASMPTFTAPTVTMKTEYEFTLKVSYEGKEDTNVVKVTVYPVIIADAGENQSVIENASVNLDGSKSTAENVTYAWTASDDNIVITNADQVAASFTAPAVDVATDFTFTLKVTYDENYSATSDVIITVYPEIMANAGDDQSAMSTSTVTLDGSMSSSDVTYAWSTTNDNITITDADKATATFVAPEVTLATEITFTLTVSGQNNQVKTDDVVVTVYPQIIANAGDDQTVMEGTSVNLDGSNSSANVTYAWTSNNEAVIITDADKATASFTAPEVTVTTDITFTLTITDTHNQTATDQVMITVYPEISANAGDDQTVNEGDAVTLNGSNSSDNVTYAWTSSDASIVITNADKATASFTAPSVEEATAITFTLTVSDEFGQEVTDEVVITVNPVEEPTSVDPSSAITLNVYPNPTTSNINVEVTQNATAQVMNSNGQVLQTVTLLKGNNTIDLSTYNFGIYFISVQSEDAVEVVKVMKK